VSAGTRIEPSKYEALHILQSALAWGRKMKRKKKMAGLEYQLGGEDCLDGGLVGQQRVDEALAVLGARVDEQVDVDGGLAIDDDGHLEVVQVLVILHDVVAAGSELSKQNLFNYKK
jgi:hypothetical protein